MIYIVSLTLLKRIDSWISPKKLNIFNNILQNFPTLTPTIHILLKTSAGV